MVLAVENAHSGLPGQEKGIILWANKTGFPTSWATIHNKVTTLYLLPEPKKKAARYYSLYLLERDHACIYSSIK
jgi:hypothetical protein